MGFNVKQKTRSFIAVTFATNYLILTISLTVKETEDG